MDPTASTGDGPEQQPQDSKLLNRKPKDHRPLDREPREGERLDRSTREPRLSAPLPGSLAGDRTTRTHEKEGVTREHDRKDQRHKERRGLEKRPVGLTNGGGESRDRKEAGPKDRESRSRRPKERAPKEKEIRISRSRPRSLPRKAIWGERGEDVCAPTHDILRDKAPDHNDAPWFVRMWIAAYMRYRGLDDNLAANVHYTGAEFKQLTLPDMVELFIAKCSVKQREAEILGRDVWECVHMQHPTATQFGRLDEFAKHVGEDVGRLRALVSWDSGIFSRILSLLLWIKTVAKILVLWYQQIVSIVVVAMIVHFFIFKSIKEHHEGETTV